MSKLKRSSHDKILGGVCGGMAKTYGWDPAITRILTAVIVLLTGIGLLLYIIAWVVIPVETEHKKSHKSHSRRKHSKKKSKKRKK